MFCSKKSKKNKEDLYRCGIGAGIAEIFYVLIIALFLMTLESLFPKGPGFAPLNFLFVMLLFVFSAGFSALIVFAKPVYLALQKKWEEAVMTLVTTLITILIGAFIVLMIIILFK